MPSLRGCESANERHQDNRAQFGTSNHLLLLRVAHL